MQRAQRAVAEAQAEVNRRNQFSNGNRYSFNRVYNIRKPSEFVRVYGLDFVAADPVLRSQLELPTGEGLVVVTLTPEGLADKAGIKKNDVIAKVNLKPVNNPNQALEAIERTEKPEVYFDLYRAGKPVHLSMSKPAQPEGATSYYIGVAPAPVDATLRSHLTELPDKVGLIATDVVAEGPAWKAGVRLNDILIRVNDQPLTTPESLVDLVQKSRGEPVPIEVLRAGKKLTITVTPERRQMDRVQVVATVPGPDNWVEKLSPYLSQSGPLTIRGQVVERKLSKELQTEVDQAIKELITKQNALDEKASRDLQSHFDQKMKDLDKQMEDLRKTLEALGKTSKSDSEGDAVSKPKSAN